MPPTIDPSLLAASGRSFTEVEDRLKDGKIVLVGCMNPETVAHRFWQTTRNGLKFHQGVFYAYDLDIGHYRVVEDEDFNAQVLTFINTLYKEQTAAFKQHFDRQYADQLQPRPLRGAFKDDVLCQLKGMTIVPSATDLPAWVGASRPGRFIALANGIIDLDVLIRDGTVKVEDHTPAFLTTAKLPFDYVPDARCPRWEAFMDQVLEGDKDRIALIQEYIGYTLTPSARMQRFILLEGTGSNGKGVLCEVVIGLLGPDNVSAVALERFADNFALATTHRKLLNICNEATSLSPRIENVVKEFVGGDLMSVDRKYKDQLHFKPTARILITTNKRPKISDESDGMWRRMMVIPFRVTIPDADQDPFLAETLLAKEGPGIFLWAVDGLRRLTHQQRFTIPAMSAAVKEEFKAEDNPIRRFLTEAPLSHQMVAGDVYSQYVRWCDDNGERSTTAEAFGKSLRTAIPGLKKAQVRVNGIHKRVYQGLPARPAEAGSDEAPVTPGT